MKLYEKYLLSEGKYDYNNLDDDPAYYKVKSSFPLYILSGHKASGAYYGSSQIYQGTYDKVMAKPGWEIHNLAGGLFVVIDGKGYHVNASPEQKDPFERGRVYQKFDLSKLEKIEKSQATRFGAPQKYYGK